MYIENGFDGFNKSKVTAVEEKDGVYWYSVKGAIRRYPESMLHLNKSRN